ncbi:TEL2-interacting protein 1-like [Papilio xuthus]|uniref:TEL2-interacting protein 1-like n=1 Tax=Papilio xuthus TaxID=66420 RepID=A0A194QFT2_PAPXU|nr:TEL2-interacting protein 1-like [Papilio xuthus]
MNTVLKEIFTRMKPLCEAMMVTPSKENVAGFAAVVGELNNDHVQEMHQYLLYPLITHFRSRGMQGKVEQQKNIVDALTVVLEKVHINNTDICLKILTGFMPLIFDKTRPGMIADVPEEVKLSAMKCLTALMLGIDQDVRIQLFKTQVPLLAQIIFVSVHIAKLEKLRSLRLAAIKNMTAFTAIHDKLTDSAYQIRDSNTEFVVVDMLSSILPGVLSALQDIAMDTHNPGHAVVVSALNTSHRVICITMNDKLLPKKSSVTAKDFADMIAEKTSCVDKDVSSKGLKDIVRRSPEWYTMAGEKLSLVVRSLVPLSAHEHVKVRKELAVLCSRILNECNQSMQPSIPIVLDVLLSLSNDSYPHVAQYCSRVLKVYFTDSPKEKIVDTLDTLCENFLNVVTNLPRVLNNINSSRKLVGLDLVYGYIRVLSYGGGGRLTSALTSRGGLPALCDALRHAAALHTQRVSLATRPPADTHVTELTSNPLPTSPWLEFRHLDNAACVSRLREICQLVAEADCAHLVLDHLLDLFQQRDCELAYIINCIGSAPKSSPTLAKRILDIYLEEDLWYLPLELDVEDPALSQEETLDVNVYNPRGWTKDSVPGLFEGATEVRYTGISYQQPRPPPPNVGGAVGGGGCRSPAQLQRHLVLSCLLTEGVGEMAAHLKEQFQPYLMKTLCLLLERVGSRYELLHIAGLQASTCVSAACGHAGTGELIAANGDYLTNQITNKLKKVWNIQSALEILSVVMRYSDTAILDYLYGIVDDVLVQSCDKYHEKDLYAYLQVFLTFITYIRKWFHIEEEKTISKETEIPNVLKDVLEFAKNQKEVEEMLHKEDVDKKSAEEMYLEDVKNKEENEMDYDDTVTKEAAPLPRHVTVTMSILRRTINFMTSPRRDESVLALRVVRSGLVVLQEHEEQLLPLVHAAWSPLNATVTHPPVAMAALDLLVTMATLSKDFIRSRASKDVLPHIYKYLKTSSSESLLKDKGSAYRLSAAYRLQQAMLRALPRLLLQLAVDEVELQAAMDAAVLYLSKNQPQPLQELSVNFFSEILSYNYGAVWYFLRTFCGNERVLTPPRDVTTLQLCDVIGTPYKCTHTDYDKNIKLLFKKHKC